MQLSAHLDIDTVAHGTDEEVTVLLDLTAPATSADKRAPQAVQVVLDRSGSMDGAPLTAAKAGIRALIQRLEPTDWFGLVIFDNEVDNVWPAQPLTDKAAALRAVDAVEARGMTDLSAGLMRGLQEAERATRTCASAKLLLVSDGHANAGVTDVEILGQVTATAGRDAKTVTATIGVGLGYDELLLAALSRGGGGEHVFAETADEAGAALVNQVEGLLSQSVQSVSLQITMEPTVAGVVVHNDLPLAWLPGGVQVELGSLFGGERRKLLMTFTLPAGPKLGLAKLATFDLRYVELPALEQRTITIPVSVNVVASTAGRVADPLVVSERAYLAAAKERLAASTLMRAGDRAGSARSFRAAGKRLRAAAAMAPASSAPLLQQEADDLDREAVLAATDDAARASKRSLQRYSESSRSRGR